MSSLVIVESPAKARTISRILGKGYAVEASYGHVRDLPERAEEIPAKWKKEKWARLGVNVSEDFEPLYIVPKDKKKHVQKLKNLLKDADELLLATDEDREGESISWHVVEVLKPKVPVRRIVFHEITDTAIKEALESPREIDNNLVRAQENRRIIDRLFGYQLSPVLWKKVRTGLSAGRVQSVAVRLCVIRERDRRRFRRALYWDAEAEFVKDGQSFTARLVRMGEAKLARGGDFDPDSGELKERSGSKAPRLWIKSEDEIGDLIDGWSTPWQVTSIEDKPFRRKPPAPFTTSSMQQEANRKLRFAARHTMRVAQRLYEGIDLGGERVGLITYMRTDSLTLSNKALSDAQEVIRGRYGDEFTDGPRQYKTKSKGAQEAHEAIRPSEISRTPEDVKAYLSADELKLYELIWKRTVASQMSEARLRRTAVEITAGGDNPGVFAATGQTIEFPGFLRAYVEGSDDPRAEIADREVLLPPLSADEQLDPASVEASSHETSPPARYTEASLVKKLEAEGIGRPSTYASIIETIQNRGYIVKQGNALVPTFTAHAVTQLLESHFHDYVDTAFTAKMEQRLDEIAQGERDWKANLERFYFGDGADEVGLERLISTQEPKIDYPAIPLGAHPQTEQPLVVKVGRYGPYVQHVDAKGEKSAASIPPEIAPADLTVEIAVELLAKAAKGATLVGRHPDGGEPIYLMEGRYGPYVQVGETPERGSKAPKPRRASVPKELGEDGVTLELALKWLSLPRTLGENEGGDEVVATKGRFGPYVKAGKETRSIPDTDDVYTITLERALELLAQPKARGRSASRKVLKDFGTDGGGLKVELLDGRYGPYLTNGELNASLPKGADPDALDLAGAVAMLAERGKAPKRRAKRKS